MRKHLREERKAPPEVDASIAPQSVADISSRKVCLGKSLQLKSKRCREDQCDGSLHQFKGALLGIVPLARDASCHVREDPIRPCFPAAPGSETCSWVGICANTTRHLRLRGVPSTPFSIPLGFTIRVRDGLTAHPLCLSVGSRCHFTRCHCSWCFTSRA
jgi:hypothetical protein